MTRTTCCWALFATLLLAACSGDDDAGESSAVVASTSTDVAATTSTVDPRTVRGYPRVCAMAPVDVVSAATGATVVSSQEGALQGQVTCNLRNEADEKVAAVSAGPPERFTEAQAAADAKPVDGLGEGAVWTDGTLYVLVQDESLTVKLFPAAGVAPADLEAVTEAIATEAVARYAPPLVDETTP